MKSKRINTFTGNLFGFFLFLFFTFLLNACSSDNDGIDSSGSGGKDKSSYPVAKAIDLGLPSGTKWASWNVGASSPEQCGGYYAWGETEVKSRYDWSTYKYGRDSEDCDYIGEDIAGTQYDVAHVKWGGSWRMPSIEQIKELADNCFMTWTQYNGTNGVLITGPNGNTIFLPAAFYYLNSNESPDVMDIGYYWSSSLFTKWGNGASYLCFYFSTTSVTFYCPGSGRSRFFGHSVRAVCL